jgi:hypothetical protein
MARQKPNPKAFGKPAGVCLLLSNKNSFLISINSLDSCPHTAATNWVLH